MHVFFNAYKCICARARPSVASEGVCGDACREARGGGTTWGDPSAGGCVEPSCTEARGVGTVEVAPRPVGSVSHRVGQSEGAVPSAGERVGGPEMIEELRRSMQRRLAGFALRQICDAQDFLGWAGLIGSDPGHAFFEMSVLVVRLRLVLESLSVRPNRARV